jgi:N-methylhydantoinase A
VAGTGRLPSLAWPALTEGPVEPSADALIVEDDVFFGNPQEPVAVPTRFYDRDRLLAGNRVNGPAILLQKDSTTVVPPGAHAQVDRAGNLVIHFS